MRQILRSDKLPGPRFNYSPCVKVGSIYQLAGMIGLDLTSGHLVDGGPFNETQTILRNLDKALPDFGLTWHMVYSARVYTTDFSHFDQINQAWGEIFNDTLAPPARSALGVSALPLGASVEIEFAFYKE